MSLHENYSSSSYVSRLRPARSTTTFNKSSVKSHRKTISSPNETPCKDSISTEYRANSPISNPLNFNFLHQKYQDTLSEIHLTEKGCLDSLPIGKRYMNNINRLNQEIQIMSSQLKLANETIALLTSKLQETNNNHALQIQELHERHEQKIRKIKNDIDKLLIQAQNKPSSSNLQKIVMEKNFEIEEQNRGFTETIASLTDHYEIQLKTRENEHRYKISMLKNQFLDVIQELKDRFLGEILSIQRKYKGEVEQVKEAMKLIGNKEGGSESEISTAVEIEHDKKSKPQDSLSDLQIIEELSFQQNIFVKPFEESVGSSDELDASLRVLINQISLDGELSLTDILNR